MLSFLGSPTCDHRAHEAKTEIEEVDSQFRKALAVPPTEHEDNCPPTSDHDSPPLRNLIHEQQVILEAPQEIGFMEELKCIEECHRLTIRLHAGTFAELPWMEPPKRLDVFEASLRTMLGQIRLTLHKVQALKANSHGQATRRLDCDSSRNLEVLFTAEYHEASPGLLDPFQNVQDTAEDPALSSPLPAPSEDTRRDHAAAAGLTTPEQRLTRTTVINQTDDTHPSLVRSQFETCSTSVAEWPDFTEVFSRPVQGNSDASTIKKMRSSISPPDSNCHKQLVDETGSELSTQYTEAADSTIRPNTPRKRSCSGGEVLKGRRWLRLQLSIW